MLVKSALQRTRFGIILGADLTASSALLVFEESPGECVLQNRQMSSIIAELVQETVDKPGVHSGACETQGLLDRVSYLFPSHHRNQIMASIDQCRQCGEPAAIAEEVGPHGQDNIDGRRRGSH